MTKQPSVKKLLTKQPSQSNLLNKNNQAIQNNQPGNQQSNQQSNQQHPHKIILKQQVTTPIRLVTCYN